MNGVRALLEWRWKVNHSHANVQRERGICIVYLAYCRSTQRMRRSNYAIKSIHVSLLSKFFWWVHCNTQAKITTRKDFFGVYLLITVMDEVINVPSMCNLEQNYGTNTIKRRNRSLGVAEFCSPLIPATSVHPSCFGAIYSTCQLSPTEISCYLSHIIWLHPGNKNTVIDILFHPDGKTFKP